MLTRAGWAVAAGAITTLAVGRLLGAQELYILATMAGALLALALAWVRRPSTIPVLERHLRPDRPMAGSPARVEVLASGHGRRKTAAATVVDQVAGTVGARLLLGPIAPDAVHRVGYRLPTSQRGPLTVGPLDVEVSDPFGLARRRWRQGGPVQITVLPAVEALMGTPVGVGGDEQVAAGVAQRGAARTIADLATLRPYVVGDDLRRVHWPTSARVDDLVVRRDEERPQGQVSVLLDTGEWASAAAFEQAVSAAATLVHATAQADDRIRLQTTSGFDSGALEARHSEGALLETLAHLRCGESGPVGSPLESPRRGTLVVLVEADGTGAEPQDRGNVRTVVVRFGGVLDQRMVPAAAGPTTVQVPAATSFAAAWRAAGLLGAPR